MSANDRNTALALIALREAEARRNELRAESAKHLEPLQFATRELRLVCKAIAEAEDRDPKAVEEGFLAQAAERLA